MRFLNLFVVVGLKVAAFAEFTPLYPERLEVFERSIPSMDAWVSFPRGEPAGLRMGQAWVDENPLYGGTVFLGYSEGYLFVMADMPDRDIFNPELRFNEPSFKVGDVFEIFLQAEGASSYFEFHVTPENQRFQLTFRAVEAKGGGAGRFNHSRNEIPLSIRLRVDPDEKRWQAFVAIPLRELVEDNQPIPTNWRVSFGRYDYTRLPDGEMKVDIFSTSPHNKLSFHRREEWIPMKIQKELKMDEWPHAVLKSDSLSAWVFLPDAEEGFYRGGRFDWSGIVAQVEYQGTTFLTRYHEGEHDPHLQDAVAGLVDEFGIHRPLGYEQASPGETFLKIGVGELRRSSGDPYDSFEAYEVVDPGTWTVESRGDRARFIQEITGPRGWGYRYTKEIMLDETQPVLISKRQLENIGTRKIETTHYNHHFIRINDRDVGSGYHLELPFVPRIEAVNQDGWMTIAGSVAGLAHDPVPGVLWARLSGFSDMKTGEPFRVVERESGASVEIETDLPFVDFCLFATRRVFCPESFVSISLEPGEAMEWSSRYRFQNAAGAPSGLPGE